MDVRQDLGLIAGIMIKRFGGYALDAGDKKSVFCDRDVLSTGVCTVAREKANLVRDGRESMQITSSAIPGWTCVLQSDTHVWISVLASTHNNISRHDDSHVSSKIASG